VKKFAFDTLEAALQLCIFAALLVCMGYGFALSMGWAT
jgi:hypothetical protein